MSNMELVKNLAYEISDLTKCNMEIYQNNLNNQKTIKKIKDLLLLLYSDITELNTNLEKYDMTESDLVTLERIFSGTKNVRSEIAKLKETTEQDSYTIESISSNIVEMAMALGQLKIIVTKKEGD